MINPNRNMVTLAFLCAALILSTSAHAQQSNKEKDLDEERKASAAEDEAEDQLSITEKIQKKLQTDFAGIFQAVQDEDNPEVIGTIQAEICEANGGKSARTFQVKLQDASLKNKLLHYDQKRIQVQGKLRNEGKYLVVVLIREPAPGMKRTERRMAGGI